MNEKLFRVLIVVILLVAVVIYYSDSKSQIQLQRDSQSSNHEIKLEKIKDDRRTRLNKKIEEANNQLLFETCINAYEQRYWDKCFELYK